MQPVYQTNYIPVKVLKFVKMKLFDKINEENLSFHFSGIVSKKMERLLFAKHESKVRIGNHKTGNSNSID